MLPQLLKLKGTALDFFFPQWCVGCGKEGNFLCSSCLQSSKQITPPICPRCGIPQTSNTFCPNCAGSPAEIDGIRAPFKFDGVMRQAVHQFKYQNLRALAAPLAELLCNYLNQNPLPAEILVPVPLHPKRLRERGYNQSNLLAQKLSQLRGLPVMESLIRRKYTTPQARTTSVTERHKNVVDVFTCPDTTVKGKQVLLIDDVATSGATLDACARALKAAGAMTVWGLVLAREI